MKIEVTAKELGLIKEALEHFYYICKDDSEYRHNLEAITNLETSLLNQYISQREDNK